MAFNDLPYPWSRVVQYGAVRVRVWAAVPKGHVRVQWLLGIAYIPHDILACQVLYPAFGEHSRPHARRVALWLLLVGCSTELVHRRALSVACRTPHVYLQ